MGNKNVLANATAVGVPCRIIELKINIKEMPEKVYEKKFRNSFNYYACF